MKHITKTPPIPKRKHPWPGRLAVLVAVAVAGAVNVSFSGMPGAAAQAGPKGGGAIRVGPDAPVTAGVADLAPAQNSPVVVADPTDPRFMVVANRLDAPDYSCALQLSGDGGRGWVAAEPIPKLPRGADKCYAPDVAFDRTGLLYYLFVGLEGLGNEPMGIFVTTSRDRGRTFSKPRQLLPGKTPGPRFSVRLAIDRDVGRQGRMHLVWVQATSPPAIGSMPDTPNPVMAAYSDDGGRTFTTPMRVSDPKRKRVVAPALRLGPDHAVHVLYYDLEDDSPDYQGLEGPVWEGNWSLVLHNSYDSGRSFGSAVVVDAAIVPTQRVMLIFTMPPATMAVDPSSGSVFVAWPDARNGDWDVLMRRSSDRGRSWSKPIRLNDDPMKNGRHQYLPALSVARNGRLDAIFADRRNSADNRRNDIYFTSSLNRGRSFTPNVRLTQQASDSRVGPSYITRSADGLFDFGARFALTSESSSAVAAWTDTRNAGGGVTNQEIFSARIDDLPVGPAGESSSRNWLVPLLAGGVVLGVAVAATLRRRRRPVAAPGPDTDLAAEA